MSSSPQPSENGHRPVSRQSSSQNMSWKELSKLVMELDELNYAQQNNVIVIELQCLLAQSAQSASPNNDIAKSVMHILYERALREVVSSGFPVSASILDALSKSSTEVFDIFQSLMRVHFNDLQKKLEEKSVLNYNDVGIVFLLLSIYRRNKLGGQASQLSDVFNIILNAAVSYVSAIRNYSENLNSTMTMLYGLISYSLEEEDTLKIDVKTISMINFLRRNLVKHSDIISQFTKVLMLDILERMQNSNKPVILYQAIYSKIFMPDIFIIPGLETFVSKLRYPLTNGDNDINNKNEKDITSVLSNNCLPNNNNVDANRTSNDSVFVDKKEVIVKQEVIAKQEVVAKQEAVAKLSNLNGNCIQNNNKHEKGDSIKNKKSNINFDQTETICIISDSDEEADGDPVSQKPPPLKWSVSQLQQEHTAEEKTTKLLEVPETCISRVIGFQGAIARKLELESNASIEVLNSTQPDRPVTSCITAHKLVTGCLGIASQVPEKQMEEEKLKLSNARVQRQTDVKDQKKIRLIKITGSESEVAEATRLIEDIITCGVTVHVPLDFSVDEITEKYGGKLGTIGLLLNIYLEVEELEDEKVVLNISGDKKSCQDAKRLIFEEIGSFRSQHGHLFFFPEGMMNVLKTAEGVTRLVHTVQSITNARILYLTGEEGYAVFISGYQHQVNRSLQIFQKINAEVLCCLSDTNDVKCEDEDLTTEDICHYIEEYYKKGSQDSSSENRHRPTLKKMKKYFPKVVDEQRKERLRYSKGELVDLASSSLSKTFPKDFEMLRDPVIQEIILTSCKME